ncbi:MAG: pqqD [Prosthecobacter sp.]|nr:pqqD [Prosthecobacter sp.]
MMTQPTLGDDARPKLAAKAQLRIDPISGEPVLLYPEGMLRLNGTAHAIAMLCDGEHALEKILGSLAVEFEVSAEELRSDVVACLHDLQTKRLILY